MTTLETTAALAFRDELLKIASTEGGDFEKEAAVNLFDAMPLEQVEWFLKQAGLGNLLFGGMKNGIPMKGLLGGSGVARAAAPAAAAANPFQSRGAQLAGALHRAPGAAAGKLRSAWQGGTNAQGIPMMGMKDQIAASNPAHGMGASLKQGLTDMATKGNPNAMVADRAKVLNAGNLQRSTMNQPGGMEAFRARNSGAANSRPMAEKDPFGSTPAAAKKGPPPLPTMSRPPQGGQTIPASAIQQPQTIRAQSGQTMPMPRQSGQTMPISAGSVQAPQTMPASGPPSGVYQAGAVQPPDDSVHPDIANLYNMVSTRGGLQQQQRAAGGTNGTLRGPSYGAGMGMPSAA